MYEKSVRSDLAGALAAAFLAGPWNPEAMLHSARLTFGSRPPWAVDLVDAVWRGYHRPPSDRPRELTAFIDLSLLNWRPGDDDNRDPPAVRRWLIAEPQMGRRHWPVPEIASVGALARFLDLSGPDLAWMADTRGLERTVTDPRLRHYSYATIPRNAGPVRLIERPKQRLKATQRQLLHEILDRVPVHGAAHGFTRGRSVRSHAATHTGRFVLVRFDLKDFFASVAAGRVYGIFRTAGYAESVAHLLTGLTTNVVPGATWHQIARPNAPDQISAHHRLGAQLRTPHLPQGAPTSPALANLAAFNLDRRLTGLAASLDLAYSRYVDDLTFSGAAKAMRALVTLRAAVAEIAREEGFAINAEKTSVATRSGCQRVCGVVVNQHPNVARHEYDSLKALLHNAQRDGVASQNRDKRPDFRAHLLGRIAWVASLNPERGEKLHRQFAALVWP